MWDHSSLCCCEYFLQAWNIQIIQIYPAYSGCRGLVAFLRSSKVVPNPSFELCFEHLLCKLQSLEFWITRYYSPSYTVRPWKSFQRALSQSNLQEHQTCNYIKFNATPVNMRFRNGTDMKSTTEATYLCSLITNTPDPAQEICRRISSMMPILQRLDIVRNKARSNRKWKPLAYTSVMVSCVLYGLECFEPTQNIGRMLEIFQLKGLRKILNLHTTYIKRNNTNESNEYVYQQANHALEAHLVGPVWKINLWLRFDACPTYRPYLA